MTLDLPVRMTPQSFCLKIVIVIVIEKREEKTEGHKKEKMMGTKSKLLNMVVKNLVVLTRQPTH